VLNCQDVLKIYTSELVDSALTFCSWSQFPSMILKSIFSSRVVVVRIWTQSLVKFELLEVPNECKKNRHFLCEYFFGCFQGNRN
jgi:hypothetical protein